MQQGNSKLLYKTLKNLRKNEHQGIQGIDDQDGNIILTTDDITNRRQQYYMNIMDGYTKEHTIPEYNVFIVLLHEITAEEINEVFSNLKNDKAAGMSNIKAEVIKYMRSEGSHRTYEDMDIYPKCSQ